jgi:excisionase family DNA binding protein
MSEAAAKLGVTNHRIRRLIKDRVLAAEQVVPGAPYQIPASDLQDDRVMPPSRETVARVASISKIKFQCSQILEEGVHNERIVALNRKNALFAGPRSGCGELGLHCLAHRNLQIARRQSASLLHRCAHQARQSVARLAARRAHALGLGNPAPEQQARSLTTRIAPQSDKKIKPSEPRDQKTAYDESHALA